jgi:Chaperone of endosialidase
MPITSVPSQYLSDTLAKMQQQLDELGRAVGRPTAVMRDGSDNTVSMLEGQPYPVLVAPGQDASLILGQATVAVADETGRNLRPIVAQTFNGPLVGDSTGVHHGDVGTPTESHNHYGDLHGNSFGFHYGAVGDGSTQYQINALNVFSTGHFGIQHGNVGVPGDNWTLYGTVVAPSERRLKTEIASISDPGGIVDSVPSYRWRWDPAKVHDPDDEEHAGILVDDLEHRAPWLVRHEYGSPRSYEDRDIIGILWAALREERATTKQLEARVRNLESQQRS